MDYVALFVILILVCAVAAAIVVLGSLPKKIAEKRGHPHVDAVNAAAWIGLATGVLWPLAFVWAFLPYPAPASGGTGDGGEADSLRTRIDELEAQVRRLQAGTGESAS